MVRRDALLVLDLRLHVVDSIRGLNLNLMSERSSRVANSKLARAKAYLKGDGLAGKSLDKDLHGCCVDAGGFFESGWWRGDRVRGRGGREYHCV